MRHNPDTLGGQRPDVPAAAWDDWNRRYVAYAAAHGRSPPEQLAQDRADWPGGHMAGYVAWNRAAWRTWLWAHGLPGNTLKSDAEHRSFDAWLPQWIIGGT